MCNTVSWMNMVQFLAMYWCFLFSITLERLWSPASHLSRGHLPEVRWLEHEVHHSPSSKICVGLPSYSYMPSWLVFRYRVNFIFIFI